MALAFKLVRFHIATNDSTFCETASPERVGISGRWLIGNYA